MTAGIKPTRYQLHFPEETPPGVQLNYHADQSAHLARALTYVYERTMFDVLKERVLESIGAKASWPADSAPWSPVETRSHGPVPVNAGFALLHISAEDLARIGHLYLNKGRWKDRRLISEKYIAESWTEIPFKDIRRKTHRGQGYGLYWWRLVPGVWFMSGTGNQSCLVWPEHGLVMTKVNERDAPRDGTHVRDIFPLLHRAVTGKESVFPEEP